MGGHMSTAAVESRLEQTYRFYQAAIGKKVVMAATGLILVGFLVAHLAGNLQIFLGPEALDEYALLLREHPAVVWGARAVLLFAVVTHIVAAVQLTRLQRKARPVGYRRNKSVGSSYASRTMMWSGPIIAAFVVYHLLHFTFGIAHPTFPDFEAHRVYRNVVMGFQQPIVATAYIVAIVMLGLHLYHGLWSMFQSVGINHPGYNLGLRRFAAVTTFVIVAGNISIPLSVLLGLVRL
jgi:succinate dehydrogenase / fumarate reductase cytochrome b subunit